MHPVSDPGSLTAALNAANSGDTILLLRNVEYNMGIVIEGKYISFDLNGCTLNVTNASDMGLEVGSGGEVGLTGEGAFNVAGSNYGVYAHDGGTATVNNANASVTGGTGVYVKNGGVVTIDGAISAVPTISLAFLWTAVIWKLQNSQAYLWRFKKYHHQLQP